LVHSQGGEKKDTGEGRTEEKKVKKKGGAAKQRKSGQKGRNAKPRIDSKELRPGLGEKTGGEGP